MVIAAGADDINQTGLHMDDGDIKGAAAQVVHQNIAGVALLQHAEQGGSRGRLVDRLRQQAKAGQLPGGAGGMALSRAKVGRAGDDSGDAFGLIGRDRALLPQGGDRVLDQLTQDVGGDLLGAKIGPIHKDAVAGLAHVALDLRNNAVRIHDRILLGGVADLLLRLAAEEYHGGCGQKALRIFDELGLAGLVHPRDAGIGGAEVDTKNKFHIHFSSHSDCFDSISVFYIGDGGSCWPSESSSFIQVGRIWMA